MGKVSVCRRNSADTLISIALSLISIGLVVQFVSSVPVPVPVPVSNTNFKALEAQQELAAHGSKVVADRGAKYPTVKKDSALLFPTAGTNSNSNSSSSSSWAWITEQDRKAMASSPTRPTPKPKPMSTIVFEGDHGRRGVGAQQPTAKIGQPRPQGQDGQEQTTDDISNLSLSLSQPLRCPEGYSLGADSVCREVVGF